MSERPNEPPRTRNGIVLVVLLVLLTYWPMLAGKIPFPAQIVTQFPPWETIRGPAFSMPKQADLGDLATQIYPWKSLIRQGIGHGEFPLWNRHALLGAPFLAESQSGLFSPFNLFYYFLSPPVAWALGFLLRGTLAGVLTLFFMRSLGATGAGSVAGALVFSFCGFLTAFKG